MNLVRVIFVICMNRVIDKRDISQTYSILLVDPTPLHTQKTTTTNKSAYIILARYLTYFTPYYTIVIANIAGIPGHRGYNGQ